MSARIETFGPRQTAARRERERFEIFGYAPTGEDIAWFSVTLAVALIGGWWLIYVAQILMGDALARVTQAHAIILSRDPHLAAIGFIWPPLPSVAEIPFVLLLSPFTAPIYAGQIVSALFTAGLAVMLSRALSYQRVPRRWRIPLVATILLNPLVFFSGINGMTENIFLFFVIGATSELTKWEPGEQRGLLIAAILLGLGFFVRYEAVAFAAAGVVALIIRTWSVPIHRDRIEAMITAFVAPVGYCVMLWMLWTGIFLDDPFAWLTGTGSNIFFTEAIRAGLDPVLSPLYHNFPRSLAWSAERLFTLFPPYLPLIAIATVRALWKRDRIGVMLVGLALVGPFFQWLQTYRGQLLISVRFWIYCVAFSPLLVAYLARDFLPAARSRIYAVAVLAFTISMVPTLFTMATPGTNEETFARAVLSLDAARITRAQDNQYAALNEAVAFIDDLHRSRRDSLVMVDGLLHGGVALYVDDPSRIASDPDRDFEKILEDPVDRVNYILVAGSQLSGTISATRVGARFPTLWREGAPWASYVAEFPDYYNSRLFRVLSTAEQAQGVRPIPPPR